MKRFSLIAASLALLLATVRAVRYEQVAPQPVPTVTPGTVLPDTPPMAAPDEGNRIVVPVLRGLVFVESAGDIEAAGVSHEGIDLSRVSILNTPEFAAKLNPFVGHELTLKQLNEITRLGVKAMTQADRPVVDVVAPEQNVQSGVIQILVVTARLGRVQAEGNLWFSADSLSEQVRTKPGQEITGRSLLDDLAWLNRNPFRRVDVVFAPGALAGQSDVILRVQDRRPVRVFAGYDNTGTALTNENRVFAGVNLGQLFGRDQQLNYQFTMSPDFKKMNAHAASYFVPLPWRQVLTVYGSYSVSQPDLEMFDLKGKTWQISGRYEMPLAQFHGITQSFTAGVDFKRSNNDLGFGGETVLTQNTDIMQLALGYSMNRSDQAGETSAQATLFLSPGGVNGSNDRAHFELARSGAKPTYAYLKLSAERQTKLGSHLTWLIRGEAQAASGNLLPSEQLGFGGSMSLRGYEEREVNADSGAILINELQGPRLKFGPGQLLSFVFLDAGEAMVSDPLPGQAKRTTLASGGLGLRYGLAASASMNLAYGWQLRDSSVSPTGNHSRLHVSASLGW